MSQILLLSNINPLTGLQLPQPEEIQICLRIRPNRWGRGGAEKIFRKTSKWVPPRGPPTFETFALLNELALNETPIRAPSQQNLDVEAKRCLHTLARDTSIVIKQADKGGALVVWDRQSYIKEGLRQLSDQKFYKPLDKDPTVEFNETINIFLQDLLHKSQISPAIYSALITDEARTSYLRSTKAWALHRADP